MSVRARHVVCFLGPWKDFDAVEAVVAEVGGKGFSLDEEYSALARDPRMKTAFAASIDRVTPSFTEADEEAVAKHRAVAYVLSPPMPPAKAQQISARMTTLVEAMLEQGGATAVKGESSGIAHGRKRWLSLAKDAQSNDPIERAAALCEAWVRRPIDDEDRGVLHSCGMHLLGEPDIEMPRLIDERGGAERGVLVTPMEAVRWIDALGIYLTAEKPEGGLRDGETFRPTDEDTRRVLRSRKCDRYEDDDFFFNPNGYWNLEETK